MNAKNHMYELVCFYMDLWLYSWDISSSNIESMWIKWHVAAIYVLEIKIACQ